MPQDDQINYNVKVRLDPNTQSTDSSVIYDVSAKKFALGTGTGITITNSVNNNILTADGTQSNIIGESFFRYVGGTSTGQGFGKVAIGQFTNTTPYHLLDIGRNVTPTSNITSFPFALFFSTSTAVSGIYSTGLKIGLSRIQVGLSSGTTNLMAATIGSAIEITGDEPSQPPIIMGYYRDFTSTEINRTFSLNGAGAVGIGNQDDLTATQIYDTPNIPTWNNQQAFFQVGHDGASSSTPVTSQITQYNQASGALGTDDYGGNNVTLQLRLNADEGSYSPTSYFGTLNPKFIRFQRRNNNGSNSNWSTCGSIVLTNTGTTGYMTSSDKRLKKDFQPFPLGLNELLKINPLKYTWVDSNQIDLGCIAQELYEIYPYAVSVPKDKEDFSNDPWSIDYTKLTPLLIKSIQDQQKIIEKLNNRITHLEKIVNQ